MNNKNLFWAGAGLGIAAGLFLNSEKGQKMRAETTTYLKNQKDLINEKSGTLVDKATELMTDLKEKGNAYLQKANKEVVKPEEVNNYIDSKVNEFKNTLLAELNSRVKTNGRKVKA